MKIPITLTPQSVIPRDPNLTLRARRETRAAAPTVETVTVEVEGPGTAIGFRDNFDGDAGDSLADHLPNLGSAYTLESGPGALADMLLDGDSNLLPTSPTNAPDAASDVAGTLGDTYTLSVLFNPVLRNGSAGKGAYVNAAGRIADTDTWLLNAAIEWNYIDTDEWIFTVIVRNAAGSLLFLASVGVDGEINSPGALNRMTVDVSPAGVVGKINGHVVMSDAAFPDVPPDSVVYNCFAQDVAASKIVVDEISLMP